MITITVILAAVTATFALGLGAAGRETPRATFEFQVETQGAVGSPDELRVTHAAGDSVPNDDPDVDDVVRVVWEDETGASATLARWTGPNA